MSLVVLEECEQGEEKIATNHNFFSHIFKGTERVPHRQHL